ncbi:MAG: nickel-dependent hydrogenase large subunit [Bacillota bacterium]
MSTLIIDPITRLEGHLKLEVELDSNNVVTSAKSAGVMFRNFENMLNGRVPKDAAFLTQRICGVCPVPHAIASAKAVEKIKAFNPPMQALLIRNIILGAEHINSNITHFYHLSVMDYIKGPAMSPWIPGYDSDYRFTQVETDALVNNYVKALEMRRKALELGAIFAGKMPHAANIVPGGVTARPSSTDINNAKTYINELKTFITTTYQSDVNALTSKYSDYYNVGKGYGNLICYGAFDTNTSGGKLFPAGTVSNSVVDTFSEANIKEFNKYSYYSSPTGQDPSAGTTTPSYGKSGAYTWIKAPRYNNTPYEAGPLARTWISGDYKRGVSVMDRHMARYIETSKLTDNILSWLNSLSTGVSGYTEIGTPTSGSGAGLTEAPRGAIGHWISIASSKISKYQIITPTCWNASPMDDSGNFGPIEKSIIGTKVANPAQPVELLRIVHSFDPCLGCAVHVISPEGQEMSKFVVNSPGA